jgi:hypothetical protein
MTAIVLSATSFLGAALIAVASSVWLRTKDSLGKPFWILTLIVAVAALIFPLIFALTPPDPYGFSLLILVPSVLFFGPVAAGWLLGVVAVLLARCVRTRRELRS